MKSRASIGNHPIHPALVPIPIGAFALTLVGDIAYASSGIYFWYAFAFVSMGIGILGMALAAPFEEKVGFPEIPAVPSEPRPAVRPVDRHA